MRIWAQFLAAGRTMVGLARGREYKVVEGRAIPPINVGRPPAFGHGLDPRAAEELRRRLFGEPVRKTNPFAPSTEEPGIGPMDSSAPAPIPRASGPSDLAPRLSAPADGAQVREPAMPPSKRTMRTVDASDTIFGRKWFLRKLRWFGGSLAPGQAGQPVQTEFRLDLVKPARSRLSDEKADETRTRRAIKALGVAARNPFGTRDAQPAATPATPAAPAARSGPGESPAEAAGYRGRAVEPGSMELATASSSLPGGRNSEWRHHEL